ncbi:MAG: molecular chaperone, partial [Actinomycetia bacterium]|nr:molecular chaperone [Actinomycetes bacterium]
MSDPLGLSIGTTNLVAATVGHQPAIRRSLLTVFGHAAPEVGIPAMESADSGGVLLTGFVDRVGDPAPLVAADGASYPAEQLLVEALEAMAQLAVPSSGAPTSGVVIAIPSYWTAAMSGALQDMLGASEILAPGGVAPRLI